MVSYVIRTLIIPFCEKNFHARFMRINFIFIVYSKKSNGITIYCLPFITLS